MYQPKHYLIKHKYRKEYLYDTLALGGTTARKRCELKFGLPWSKIRDILDYKCVRVKITEI